MSSMQMIQDFLGRSGSQWWAFLVSPRIFPILSFKNFANAGTMLCP